ncbi:MAG: hypothetical protein OXT72_06275 [Gammaproteobacteria bacterium]|nr:hypothetical protein [Gammaproteobacteria bacterium]MDE2875046.1 hypothetical protein [Gemmatimonadota bacterium]
MNILRGLRGAAAAAGALLLCGCHAYLPVESPAPGTVARVHVPLRSAVANPNVPPPTVSVEGTVLSAGDTIVLEVRTRQYFGALQELVQENVYRVARDEVVAIELREFSGRRSAVLGGALLVGVAGLAVLAFGGEFGQGGEGPDNNGGRSFTIGFLGR